MHGLTRKAEIGLALGAAIVTGVVFLPFASLGVDAHHDGVMFKPALDLLSGQIPFRESFNQYGLLSTLIQALALKLGGLKLLAIKRVTVLFYALSAGILVSCWRRILPLRLVALAFALWLVFAYFYHSAFVLLPWSSVYALFFHVLALFFFLKSLENERFATCFAFLTGMSVAAAYWCRQPVGILLVGAVLGAYLVLPLLVPREGRESSGIANYRSVLKMIVAFLAGVLPLQLLFFGYLKWHQAIGDWYFQNYAWPARWSQQHMHFRSIRQRLLMSPNHALGLFAIFLIAAFPLKRWIERFGGRLARIPKWERLAYGVSAILLIAWAVIRPQGLFGDLLGVNHGWAAMVPVLCTGGVVYLLVASWKARAGRGASDPFAGDFRTPAALVAILLFSLASWPQYFPVADPRHVFWGITPFLGLFVYVWNRGLKGHANWVIVLFLVFLLPMTGFRISETVNKVSGHGGLVRNGSVLDGLWLSTDKARFYNTVHAVISDYTRANGKRPIVAEVRDALYSTFTEDLRNPGPYYMYWGELEAPGMNDLRERMIRADAPIVIVQGEQRPEIKRLLMELRYRTLWKSEDDEHLEILAP